MVVTYKCTIALSLGTEFTRHPAPYITRILRRTKMGQCSSKTSEQFNEFTSLTTIKLCEKRTPGVSQGKWRPDASHQNEAAAERRRRGCGTHDDCSGLVFVADPTGGVWIDETLGRQR